MLQLDPFPRPRQHPRHPLLQVIKLSLSFFKHKTFNSLLYFYAFFVHDFRVVMTSQTQGEGVKDFVLPLLLSLVLKGMTIIICRHLFANLS